MYLVPAHETTCATTNAVIERAKSQMRIFDSRAGMTYWTPDMARDIIALKEFKWDDHLVIVNEIGADTA